MYRLSPLVTQRSAIAGYTHERSYHSKSGLNIIHAVTHFHMMLYNKRLAVEYEFGLLLTHLILDFLAYSHDVGNADQN